MASLGPGDLFPDLDLVSADGHRAPLPKGETLYGFFKTTCPTCELTWPYLERLRSVAEGGNLAVVAVSQDPPAETEPFNERLGVGVRTLYDPPPWKGSEALGLTSVPTLVLVDGEGRIRETIVGFQKRTMEDLARRAAPSGRSGAAAEGFFRPGESVPDMRPG